MSVAPRAKGWIDVHAHFALPKSAEDLEASWRAMRAGGFLAPQPFQWSMEGALAHMDRHGIAMQMLSNVPFTLAALKASNDFGRSIVQQHPSRFGLLAALPTDDAEATLAEITRAEEALDADGFAVCCHYNDVYLSDPRLEPVWSELDRRGAVVFVHPNAYAPSSQGRPSALLEVGFETARAVVDMLYVGAFRRHPAIKFVLAPCGGALPALSGRLLLLGAEAWVPNPQAITRDEMRSQFGRFYLDTAATGTVHTLAPALAMTCCDHIVYGSDCGVPCSTEDTLTTNLEALLAFTGLSAEQIQQIGRNAARLFPRAAQRIARSADRLSVGAAAASGQKGLS